MSLQALGRVIKELFSSIAALFCDTSGCFYPILDCICNDKRSPEKPCVLTRQPVQPFVPILIASLTSLVPGFDVNSPILRQPFQLCRSSF